MIAILSGQLSGLSRNCRRIMTIVTGSHAHFICYSPGYTKSTAPQSHWTRSQEGVKAKRRDIAIYVSLGGTQASDKLHQASLSFMTSLSACIPRQATIRTLGRHGMSGIFFNLIRRTDDRSNSDESGIQEILRTPCLRPRFSLQSVPGVAPISSCSTGIPPQNRHRFPTGTKSNPRVLLWGLSR